MRIRHALIAAPLLLLSFVAIAQPKRAAKDTEDKSAPVKAERAEAKAEPSPGIARASDDLGGPPTRAAQAPVQLSPLNPEPSEFPDGGAQPPPESFDRILGDIAALRSRVSALTTTLYASKLRVVVETRGNDARIASFRVTLDEGVVFIAPERFLAEDERVVYEHSLAPGHHTLGVEIERFGAQSPTYRSWQSSRFSVVIPESQRLDAHLVLQDDSDMAQDFPASQDGQYDLRVRLRARVER